MDTRSAITLSQQTWEDISRHAVKTFPEECCGVILSGGAQERVQPLKNIQNQLHALDPETYPRDATIAYAMDIQELESVIRESDSKGFKIKAFYHSHPDHEAYFSEEDKAFAIPFGEPTFPHSAQIVVSIYSRVVKRIAGYIWSEQIKDFIEIPVKKI